MTRRKKGKEMFPIMDLTCNCPKMFRFGQQTRKLILASRVWAERHVSWSHRELYRVKRNYVSWECFVSFASCQHCDEKVGRHNMRTAPSETFWRREFSKSRDPANSMGNNNPVTYAKEIAWESGSRRITRRVISQATTRLINFPIFPTGSFRSSAANNSISFSSNGAWRKHFCSRMKHKWMRKREWRKMHEDREMFKRRTGGSACSISRSRQQRR